MENHQDACFTPALSGCLSDELDAHEASHQPSGLRHPLLPHIRGDWVVLQAREPGDEGGPWAQLESQSVRYFRVPVGWESSSCPRLLETSDSADLGVGTP